jgi:hypothetical protein
MASKSFGNVDDKAFVTLGVALEEGAWKDISIKKHDSEAMVALSPFANLPLASKWKLHGTWGVRRLVAALSVGNNVELDSEWDASQRSFASGVASEEDHQDPAHRAAAGRLRTALLDGAGTAQTQLDLDGEVEFGKKQLRLVEEKALAADLHLTGLGPKMDRIREATAALDAGTGRVPGKNRAKARSVRVREALAECAAAFNSIHDDLVWAMAHSPSGPDRDKLEKLLEPLQAALDRAPATAAATPAADATAAPAAPPATPAPDAKDPSGSKTG